MNFDHTPDQPEPFGYKISWFAVKSVDPASVALALELEEATPANWKSGLAMVYPDVLTPNYPWIFISPPVAGWILAISAWLPYPTEPEAADSAGRQFDAMLSRLTRRFDDVQFFGSHRVSDFATWARAVNGKPQRLFAYGDGQVLINVGDQTAEEAKLGLVDLTGLSPSDAGDRMFDVTEEQNAEEARLVASGMPRSEARTRARQNNRHPFPDESDVVDLAALWSVDPTNLPDQDDPLGLGLAARLPTRLMR